MKHIAQCFSYKTCLFYVQVINVSNILRDALYLEQSLNCYQFKTASGIVEDGYCRKKQGRNCTAQQKAEQWLLNT